MSELRGDHPPILQICPLPQFWNSGLKLPSYETAGSVGMDICACFEDPNIIMSIAPGERKCVPTGLKIHIPTGYEIQIRPRSGISLKTTLLMVNSPGTLDQDYTGETHVIFGNIGAKTCYINHGDRIAQWVMVPIVKPVMEVVDQLATTYRGNRGFGSTGGFTGIDDTRSI